MLFRSEQDARAFRTRYLEILSLWPVPHERLHLPTRQGETFVVACGPREAPPVILLHGSLANVSVWMGDVSRWARDFRLYAVDVIGEPGLSAPSRPPLTTDDHANWLDDVMKGLSLTQASLVGVSLGGWLALDYASRHPERIDRLALVCPAGVGRQKIAILFKIAFLRLFGDASMHKMQELVLGRDATRELPKDFTEFLDLIHRTFRPRMVKLPVFADGRLARLTMPVMAVVGGKDALLDSDGTRARLKKIGAEVRYLPDCGHLITGQTETIAAFLLAPAGRNASPLPAV